MASINKILVANRGEIAVRIMRTIAGLGLKSVAVYSEADADTPNVAMADETVCIGPPPVDQSYLNATGIIEAAKATGADAIHPGFGFLSENAAFAGAVADAGLTFIGPTPDAIDLMGNKAAAKRRMIEAGVPCVPGYEGADQTEAAMVAAADEIGFPIMVKAAAGGGGRGMRLVQAADDLPSALATARSEAENAFGSGELILEKAVIRPRHVEIQVFADTHGTVIHLGERDCSVQRRHQKVIEEAPCPVMTPDLREAMGGAAVEAARSIDYQGAGTVEFLLDEAGQFYFLEMNTRLQVEHPVTEMVTGLDLVAMQIAVAQGDELVIGQDDVRLDGHAIEVRLYAEDPAQDFLPATGDIRNWQPASGEGIRVDSGIASGQAISPFYDPMIAKIIAYGPSRDVARRRLIEALNNTVLFGLPSNKAFLVECLKAEAFAAGEATTTFIEETFPAGVGQDMPTSKDLAVAGVLNYQIDAEIARSKALNVPDELMNWSSAGQLSTEYHYEIGEEAAVVRVAPQSRSAYEVMIAEDLMSVTTDSTSGGPGKVSVDGTMVQTFAAQPRPGFLDIQVNGKTYALRNLIGAAAVDDQASGGGRITAPMHGRVIDIAVVEGQSVAPGDKLLTLEAMKMQHEILSDVTGTIARIACAADNQVGADDLLVEIDVAEDDGD